MSITTDGGRSGADSGSDCDYDRDGAIFEWADEELGKMLIVRLSKYLSPTLSACLSQWKESSLNHRTKDSEVEVQVSKVKSHQRLPWVFCIVGMLFTVAMFMIVAFYVRDRAYKIINEDKQLILCQNQNFAQVVTEWIVQDLLDTVQRNWNLVQSGAAVADFSGTTISGTLPAVFMGLTASGTPPPPTPHGPLSVCFNIGCGTGIGCECLL